MYGLGHRCVFEPVSADTVFFDAARTGVLCASCSGLLGSAIGTDHLHPSGTRGFHQTDFLAAKQGCTGSSCGPDCTSFHALCANDWMRLHRGLFGPTGAVPPLPGIGSACSRNLPGQCDQVASCRRIRKQQASVVTALCIPQWFRRMDRWPNLGTGNLNGLQSSRRPLPSHLPRSLRPRNASGACAVGTRLAGISCRVNGRTAAGRRPRLSLRRRSAPVGAVAKLP